MSTKQKRKGRNPSFFAWEERTTPPLRHGRDSSPYILRTETPLRDVPVLRMAYFPSKPHRGFDSKTRMLQPRSGLRRGSQKQPLRRCGASSPYTGEPRKRRNLSLPCGRGGGSAKPRRRGCVLPPRSFLLLAQSLLNGEVDEGADGREMAVEIGVGDAENLQAVALQESGALGVAEDGLRLGVLEAVQFDHEADAGTVKIHNAGTQHLLTEEADGIKAQKVIPKAIPLLPKAGNVISAAFCRSGGRRRSPPRRARRNRGSNPRQRRRPRGRRNPQRPHGARRSGG